MKNYAIIIVLPIDRKIVKNIWAVDFRYTVDVFTKFQIMRA